MSGDELWYWLFGRLDAKALPFVRAYDHPVLSEFIGAGAGAMVVIGAVVVVALLTYMRW